MMSVNSSASRVKEESKSKIYLTPVTAFDSSDSDSDNELFSSTSSSTRTQNGHGELNNIPKKRKRVQIIWQCINPLCSESKAKCLPYTASSFVASYYGAKSSPQIKRKVCANCRQASLNKLSVMKSLIKKNDLVISEPLPVSKDMVLLDNSDDDFKTDSSDESEFEIEPNLEETVSCALTSFGLPNQISSSLSFMSKKLDQEELEYKFIDQTFKDIEKQISTLRTELYSPFKCKLKELPSISINDCHKSTESPAPNLKAINFLPQSGELLKPQIKCGEFAFGMRGNILNQWKLGTVTESEQTIYRLKFDGYSKVLSRNHVAYSKPAAVRLSVGTRVIAEYKNGDDFIDDGKYFCGVIAEPPKIMNGFRYLIFFDDGYTSYVFHQKVRPVVHQTTPEVWEDVHPNFKNFLRLYLSQYPERPMVKLSKDQIVWAEYDGKWWATKVLEIDASLAKLLFKESGRIESIYRGSTRLSPLFKEMQQQKLRKEGRITHRRPNFYKKNSPYVEYTRHSEEFSDTNNASIKKAVARKSTLGNGNKKYEDQTKINWDNKGEIVPVEIQARTTPKSFVSHSCGKECICESNLYVPEVHLKKYPVLVIPIVLGWDRIITKHKGLGSKKVCYIAPCGRRLRNMNEVHQYILKTKSFLELDFFCYDWWVRVKNEFKPSKRLCSIPDISYGKENIPVECINSFDNSYPEYIEYSAKRLPQKNVNLNLDPDFLVCCDCEDDCSNKDTCACCQLTIQSTNACPENVINHSAGYVYRRLPEVIPTGIYECNSKCKCSKRCLNRVAQLPLRSKLQVFKTEKRGWGIRTLHDIPQGSFVCVYVGNLYTNEAANQLGKDFGDEYFAELDLIETIESRKEGYESDVEEMNDENSIISNYSDSNESIDEIHSEDESHRTDNNIMFAVRPDNSDRLLRKKKLDLASKHENGSSDKEKDASDTSKFVSVRKHYDKDEDVYIMDAKIIGNIGRYLNHSCSPNIFVQNCFVDTHDLRYPWISFFSSTYIKAGTELCWDYCYIVDQVEGKEIYCECGSDFCRGRLL